MKKGEKMRSMSLVVVSIFVLTIFTSKAYASSDLQTKKTFLSMRPTGVNLPLEYSTWHNHAYGTKDESRNAHIQLAGFYQKSSNSHELGKYFGVGNGTNQFKIGTAGTGIDLEKLNIIHDATSTSNNLAGTLSLSPQAESYGALVQIMHDIKLPGISMVISAALPFVHISRDIKIKQTKQVEYRGLTPVDFFAGKRPTDHATAAENLQGELTHAKIVGKRTAMGLADANINIGFKVSEQEDHHVFLNLGVTIPTGKKVRGEYLFEPTYGNGGHCGLGARLDAGVTAWKDKKAKLRALAAIDYRYLFEATENRTIGIKNKPFHQYYLAARKGQKDEALFPAANVLTQPLHVKPGSQFEVMTALSFACSNFIVDAGYDMFLKDQESLWVKQWNDGEIYLVNAGYKTNQEFTTLTDADHGQGSTVINKDDLDVDAAKTPVLFSHKLFASVGYTFHIGENKYPLSVGLGSSYEFGVSNADIDQWSVWFKAAGSF